MIPKQGHPIIVALVLVVKRKVRMTRKEAIDYIKQDWRLIIPTLTTKAKLQANGEDSWVCPLPNCGHGEHGDGVTFIPDGDRTKLICFGCGWTGDIIDLYMKVKGVDFNTALADLARQLNIEIDEKGTTSQETKPRPTLKRGKEYYKACVASRNNSQEAKAYLQGRGISDATADAFDIGYDGNWKSPTAIERGSNPPSSRRIIIPTSEAHYIARAIDEPKNDTEKRFAKMNEGEPGLFNEACLYSRNDEPVFVVEGAFDALSIIEVGGQAIALNSTSNISLLLGTLEDRPTSKTLILCLDRDKAGRKAEKDLRDGLKRLGTPYICSNITGEYKDANEALQKDHVEFDREVYIAKTKTSAKPDTVNVYINSRMSEDMELFKSGCDVKTGFPFLDKAIGGVFQGLYVISAISSLGKTTLAHQLADNFAESGRDVIYFPLEQSALELVTKSVARRLAQKDMGLATTALKIRMGQGPNVIPQIIEEYQQKVGNNLSIVEGNFNCDITQVESYIRNYVHKNDTRPIIFVDYLQILQPEEDRQSTKEKVDNIVTSMKRLSRDLGLTIFLISSVNRANYRTPISFESLKESGSIEYTADVVWGLQLSCISKEGFEGLSDAEQKEMVNTAKAEIPRKIDLVVLKDRNGKTGTKCFFDYYSPYDLFKDTGYEEWKKTPSIITGKRGNR